MITQTDTGFILANPALQRTLRLDAKGFATTSFINRRTGTEYISAPVREFAFALDDQSFSSLGARIVREVDGDTEVRTAALLYESSDITETSREETLLVHFRLGPLRVTARYDLAKNTPGMRKSLRFANPDGPDCRLDGIILDDTAMCPGQFSECNFYHGTEMLPEPLCFVHDGDEDILCCHHPGLDEGWVLGTTTPGILRFLMVYPHWRNLITGYSRAAAPAGRHLPAGDAFTTAAVLLSVFQGDFRQGAAMSDFRQLTRLALPPLPNPEGVMYCTWIPFLKNIHAELILALIRRAADQGFRYFVLDDGWFTAADGAVDTAKFPQGLEPIAQAVRDAGMHFGLWFNIGTSYGCAQPAEDCATRRSDGRPQRLGFNDAQGHTVQCFGSRHRDRMLSRLDDLARRYQVSYFKLDFSSISSPYGILPYGCHAQDHDYHQGYGDSVLAQYEGLSFLRRELKKRHPALLVDFSFECFGTARPNLAALEYSELHHVSNLSAQDPQYQTMTRVRQVFYRWSAWLPPERLLNGLVALQEGQAAECLLTAMVGAPLVAGDLTALSASTCKRLRHYTDAFHRLADQDPLTDLEVVLNQPDGDAFVRRQASGHGFLCVFNRGDQALTSLPWRELPCRNVLPGHGHAVPPHDCAMFTF